MKLRVAVTKSAEKHISKHGIEKREILQTLNHPRFLRKTKERYVLYGKTGAGRYLTLILKRRGNVYFLVTARENTDEEKSLYLSKEDEIKNMEIAMKKAKIKSVEDLNSLPEGLFELEEWDLEAELLEEVDAKLVVKEDVVEVAVDPETFERVKEKKMVLVSS